MTLWGERPNANSSETEYTILRGYRNVKDRPCQ